MIIMNFTKSIAFNNFFSCFIKFSSNQNIQNYLVKSNFPIKETEILFQNLVSNTLDVNLYKDIFEYNDSIIENAIDDYIQKYEQYIQEYNNSKILEITNEISKKQLWYNQKPTKQLKKEIDTLIQYIQILNKPFKLQIDKSIDEYSLNNIFDKLDNLNDQYKHKEFLGNPTGISLLDKVTDGIFGLTCITAAPGLGKTTLAAQISDYNAEQLQNPVFYLSLEVPANLLLVKMAAMKAHLPFKDCIKQNLSLENTRKYVKEILKLGNLKNLFLLSKENNITFNKIINMIEEYRKKYGNDKPILFVLDYLSLFDDYPPIPSNLEKIDGVGLQIREFIKIRTLYQNVNFIIIVAKNKAGYDNANMGSIKGTNEQEYGFETIISLEQPRIEDKNLSPKINTNVYILKSRWDFKGFLPLNFDGYKFTDI